MVLIPVAKGKLQIVASALFLLALVPLSLGLDQAAPALWHAGLATVALATLVSLAIQWARGEEGELEEEAEGEGGEHRARAHEHRAAAHRERAEAYEELAEAEEERLREASEDGPGEAGSRPR